MKIQAASEYHRKSSRPHRRILALAGLTFALIGAGVLSTAEAGKLPTNIGPPVFPVHRDILTGACSRPKTCPIKHIVFIIKENHSFDNLFAHFPGADGTSTAMVGNQRVPLGVTPDHLPFDISHSGNAASNAVNGGKMNHFYLLPGAVQFGHDYADTAYSQSEIPNYWAYAHHFTLADRFFSTIMGPSFPNHLATIAAQSGGAIDNPHGQTNDVWGCDAKGHSLVRVRLAAGPITQVAPCFNFTTLADEANRAGVSWKYYSSPKGTSGYIWNAFDAIKHVRSGTSGIRPTFPTPNLLPTSRTASWPASPGSRRIWLPATIRRPAFVMEKTGPFSKSTRS